jgi:hypothetical protein
MDTSKVTSWFEQAQPLLVAFGLKAIGAVASSSSAAGSSAWPPA